MTKYQLRKFFENFSPKEIKRTIEQHFERNYWYSRRKIFNPYFNDTTNKYEKGTYPGQAKTVMTSTWEGESDIWGIVILKLDHMFWSLHKYGHELPYYISKTDIENLGTKEDKYYISKKIIDDAAKNKEDLFLFNGLVDKSISDNELMNFYLRIKNDTIQIIAKVSKQIPFEKIPKKKKLYFVKTKVIDGKLNIDDSEEAPQYKLKNETIIYEEKLGEDPGEKIFGNVGTHSLTIMKGINDYIKYHSEIEVDKDDVFKFKDFQTMVLSSEWDIGFDIKDIPHLSKNIKDKAVGNFVKCRDILHLRHLIKKLIGMSDTDDKYYNLWKDIADDEERREKMKQAADLFNKDRKELYTQIMNLMYDKSLYWWD